MILDFFNNLSYNTLLIWGVESMNDEILKELDDESLKELLRELENLDDMCENIIKVEGDNNE